jgi:exosortase A-associated hydrolase 2
MTVQPPRAHPFFLPTPRGQRFCLYHQAAGPARAALVYVHPFAEEMNCARRMAAASARALAAQGIAVLQIDLHGCGDSAGLLQEARWEGWLDDLGDALAWLEEASGQAPGLWGLRLGALLALAHATQRAPAPARLLLWQPVLDGRRYLDQLLRLHLAGDLVHGGAGGRSSAALRAALEAGQTLDVGGYPLTPQLCGALAGALPAMPACPVDVVEVTRQASLPVSAATQRQAEAWRQQGLAVRLRQSRGAPFWSDITAGVADEVLAATLALAGDWRG